MVTVKDLAEFLADYGDHLEVVVLDERDGNSTAYQIDGLYSGHDEEDTPRVELLLA